MFKVKKIFKALSITLRVVMPVVVIAGAYVPPSIYLPFNNLSPQMQKVVENVEPRLASADILDGSGDKFVFITVASVSALSGLWPVPADWNAASNSIQVIGAGGGGGGNTSTGTARGGFGGAGGGGYSRINNLSLTPGNTVVFDVGVKGTGGTSSNNTKGGNTYFNANSFTLCTDNTVCVKAEGGETGRLSLTGSVSGGGFATTASAVGTTRYEGGDGGGGHTTAGTQGGGGGGSAGPLGKGGNGANAASTAGWRGAGGGGNGSGTAGTAGSAAGAGGTGGNGYGGAGSSPGGTGGAPGGSGTNGGGGGGGNGVSSGAAANGGTGSRGGEWVASTWGTSGGGAGGGGSSDSTGSGNDGGSAQATVGFGAGGGGGGGNADSGDNAGAGGNGSDGLIVIKYRPAVATITGTLFTDTGLGTKITTQPSVYVSVAGAAPTKASASAAGTYSVDTSILPTTGQIVTVWLNNNATYKASTVFAYGANCTSRTCTGRNLIDGAVALSTKHSAALTNANLASCDNDTGTGCADTDIGFTSNSGTVTLTYSTNLLYASASLTYDPGGNISTQKIVVNGTLTNTNTIDITSTAAGALSGTGTFNNYSATGILNYSGSTITVTTFDCWNSGNTVNFIGSSPTTIPVPLGTAYWHLGIGTVADSNAVTYTLAGAIETFGITTIGNASSTNTDTFVVTGYWWAIDGDAGTTPVVVTSRGAVTAGAGSTVNYLGKSAGGSINIAALTYQNLRIENYTTRPTNTFTLLGDITVNGTLQLSEPGESNPSILDTSTYTATIPGIVVIDTLGKIINNGTVTMTGTGAAQLSGAGTFVNNTNAILNYAGSTITVTTFTTDASGNTVRYNGTTGTVVANTYRNLTLGGTGTYTLPSSGNITMLGDLLIAFGVTKIASGSSTMFFRKGGSQSIQDDNGTSKNLGEIAVRASTGGNTTLTLGSSVRIASATVDASQTLSPGTNTLTITGSGTGDSKPFTINGTLTVSNSTVNYIGTSATDLSAATYYNLGVGTTSNTGAATTYELVTGLYTINNVLTVGNASSTNIDVLTGANAQIRFNASGTPFVLTSKGTFYAASVDYLGTSATTITPAHDSWGYVDLNLGTSADGNAVTYTAGGNIKVYGTLTVGNSGSSVNDTFDASSYALALDYNLEGATPLNLTSKGLFEDSSSTVRFSVNNGTGDNNINVAATTYNILELGVYLNSYANNFVLLGDTTVGGTLTIGNASSAGIDRLSFGSYNLTLSGTGTPLSVTSKGALAPGTGTVTYTGTTATVGAAKYKNLTLGGTGTYTLPSSGTTTLLGNLSIPSGATVASGSSTLFFRAGGSQSITDSTTNKMNLGEIAVQASTSGNTTLTMGSNIRIASATIDASQTMSANGSDTLTITGSTTPFTASGSFGTFTKSTGTVVFKGAGSTNIPTLDYYNLKVQPSANNITHTFLSGTSSISNTFTVGNGTNTGVTVTADTNATGLDMASVSISANTTLVADNSREFTLSRHFDNNGTFTHSSGTVTFEGPNTSSISGATTFNNFTSTTAGKKLKFGAGETFAFAGNFTITGADSNNIKIESTASASQWLANFSGAQSGVTYATITDSGCDVASADVTLNATSTDGGNNDSDCWIFPGAGTTFTQNDYEWFYNNDLITPVESISGSENTNPSIADTSVIPRLRMNLTVGGTLTATSQQFKLQHALSNNGPWTDIGSGVWAFRNTSVADGTTISSNLISTSEVSETYSETNPTIVANPNSATDGQDIEYDWALDPASIVSGPIYYFRMIKSNDTVLDTYNSDGYPGIRVRVNVPRGGGGGGGSSPLGDSGESGGGTPQTGGGQGGGATPPPGEGGSGGGSGESGGGSGGGGGGESPVMFDWLISRLAKIAQFASLSKLLGF